ncbi:MAG: M23 family metallopeptidase [Cyanobacteria bacterium J06598_3]
MKIDKRIEKEPAGITITPLRGFFMALLFLGIPTVSLGSLCFTLLQNNLRLSEKNEELTEIATEVKADVDSLGKEIEHLQERAGVSRGNATSREATPQKTSHRSTAGSTAGRTEGSATARKAGAESITETDAPGVSASRFSNAPTRNSSLGLPVRESGNLARTLPPRGGPSPQATAMDLLKDARAQVPELNKALDSAVKPALEEILAEEAAYPSGQPVAGVPDISSRFGLRGNPFGGGGYEIHEGLDFVGEQGDIIAATGDGKVTLAGRNGGYGLTVTIDHGYGYETLYAHMSEMRVSVGDTVKRGQIIGYIGSTGRSSGPHLHYSVYKKEVAIDPEKVMVMPDIQLADGPR